MKKFIIIIGLVLAVLFVVDKTLLKDKGMVNKVGLAGKYAEIENPKSLAEGLKTENRAPDFSLTDINGQEVRLSDYKGKKVLLNFWATWCPPCRAEMPYMEEMFKEHKNEGYEIVAVNMTSSEKNKGNIEPFVKEYGLTFTIPLDEKGEISTLYEVMAYPTSYFIDSDGIIRSKSIGGMKKEFMEKEMKKLP
ncbi:peroxiredoxin family protein [Mesobacillus zeae]|uniref:TlpA family protein disulfide reductase n=1 Tax=Mesobacillus zeae TaxID=1917180 RepID=A0A398BD62_9BACI|nr:TlpA family protein disulfide reductase [Mesobacillus zeae]RID85533.1 TlpA family protein disulfide reductase [Mesobacillus zeae]